MKFMPISDNDPRTINLVLEEMIGMLNIQEEKITKLTVQTVEKATIVEETTATEEEIETEESTEVISTPSMAGYSPSVNASQFSRALRVSWHDWAGYGTEEVLDYSIYCSTESVCTISDANLVAKNVKFSPFTIRELSAGLTYDVRIVARGINGSGEASD